MNDTKMDIQRSGETIERTAVKYSAKALLGCPTGNIIAVSYTHLTLPTT